jgi:hypothetical protein
MRQTAMRDAQSEGLEPWHPHTASEPSLPTIGYLLESRGSALNTRCDTGGARNIAQLNMLDDPQSSSEREWRNGKEYGHGAPRHEQRFCRKQFNRENEEDACTKMHAMGPILYKIRRTNICWPENRFLLRSKGWLSMKAGRHSVVRNSARRRSFAHPSIRPGPCALNGAPVLVRSDEQRSPAFWSKGLRVGRRTRSVAHSPRRHSAS